MAPVMAHDDQVVITGIGLAIPLGLSTDEAWNRSLRGESAVRALRRFDAAGHACTAAAEVADFDIADSLLVPKASKFMGKNVCCAVRAAKEAVARSGLDLALLDPYRIAIHVGSGQTGLENSEFFPALALAWTGQPELDFKNVGGRPSRLIDPYFSLRTLSNSGTAFLSSELRARGPNSNFVQSDTASAVAIATAFHDLMEDRCDVAVVGGYDGLLTVSTYLAYERVGVLSAAPPDDAYRPFDQNRDGLVLGEGAGFLVLERASDARRRGASVLCELVGVGYSTELGDMLDPKQAEATAEAAIGEVVQGRPVDFIVAHGIGTRTGDENEAKLLEKLFGRQVPVTAFKGQTGYLGAATAAVEAGFAALSVHHKVVPPIVRHTAPDPDIHLDFVARNARRLEAAAPTALCLSRSWTGQCAALLLRGV